MFLHTHSQNMETKSYKDFVAATIDFVDATYNIDNCLEFPYKFPDRSFLVVYANDEPLFAIGGTTGYKAYSYSFRSQRSGYSSPAGTGIQAVEACRELKRGGNATAQHFSHFRSRVIDGQTRKPRGRFNGLKIRLEYIPLVHQLTPQAVEHAMLIRRLYYCQDHIFQLEKQKERFEKRGSKFRNNRRVSRLRVEERRLIAILNANLACDC